MNFRLALRLLGILTLFLAVAMATSLTWAWRDDEPAVMVAIGRSIDTSLNACLIAGHVNNIRISRSHQNADHENRHKIVFHGYSPIKLIK